MFIAAMFGPHDRINPQLGHIGFSVQDFDDAVVLIRFEAVFFDDFRGDFNRQRAHAFTAVFKSDSQKRRPSLLPKADSLERSGWGMRPNMFFFSLQMPAILSNEPLGLLPSVTLPFSSQ